MRISNQTAHGYYEQLSELKETGKLGFIIAKNMRKLGDELVEFEEKRSELFRKYGEDDGTGMVTIPSGNVPDFLKEYNQYAEIEVDFDPVLMDEETFYSGNLTSDQMYNLDWMVKQG